MKLEVTLPRKYETYWTRLASIYEHDELALAAVELLWERYGDDVKELEKQRNRNRRAVAKTLQGLSQIPLTRTVKSSPRNEDCLFVGSFERRIDDQGHLTLPKDWCDLLDGTDSGWLFANVKTRELIWLPNRDANEIIRAGFEFCPVVLDSRHRLRIDEALMVAGGLDRDVVIEGKIRYFIIRNSRTPRAQKGTAK